MGTDTAIKPAESKPTDVNLNRNHENRLNDEQRLHIVFAVAEIIERGERSTSSVRELVSTHMPSGSCTRDTAIKYRNAAMQLIAAESKPMNHENIRALEVGRYTYLIERLYKKILEFEESQPPKTDKDHLKWFDTYTKLLQRLDGFGARLHAITGLNEITINNGGEKKRIVFVRPGEPKPKDQDSAPIGIGKPEPSPAPDHAPATDHAPA